MTWKSKSSPASIQARDAPAAAAAHLGDGGHPRPARRYEPCTPLKASKNHMDVKHAATDALPKDVHFTLVEAVAEHISGTRCSSATRGCGASRCASSSSPSPNRANPIGITLVRGRANSRHPGVRRGDAQTSGARAQRTQDELIVFQRAFAGVLGVAVQNRRPSAGRAARQAAGRRYQRGRRISAPERLPIWSTMSPNETLQRVVSPGRRENLERNRRAARGLQEDLGLALAGQGAGDVEGIADTGDRGRRVGREHPHPW